MKKYKCGGCGTKYEHKGCDCNRKCPNCGRKAKGERV